MPLSMAHQTSLNSQNVSVDFRVALTEIHRQSFYQNQQQSNNLSFNEKFGIIFFSSKNLIGHSLFHVNVITSNEVDIILKLKPS